MAYDITETGIYVASCVYGCLFLYCRCSERLNNDFDAEEFYDADDVEGDVGESEGRGEPEGAEDECNDGKMNVCEVKMERRRRKIIQELLDTEQSYQHHLDHIVTVSGGWGRD